MVFIRVPLRDPTGSTNLMGWTMSIIQVDNFDDLYYIYDLYIAGITEDGEDYIAERFHVIFNRDGGSWHHNRAFNGAAPFHYVEDYEEWFGFKDIRDVAKANCQEIIDAIKSAGYIDTSDWYWVPSYSSGLEGDPEWGAYYGAAAERREWEERGY